MGASEWIVDFGGNELEVPLFAPETFQFPRVDDLMGVDVRKLRNMEVAGYIVSRVPELDEVVRLIRNWIGQTAVSPSSGEAAVYHDFSSVFPVQKNPLEVLRIPGTSFTGNDHLKVQCYVPGEAGILHTDSLPYDSEWYQNRVFALLLDCTRQSLVERRRCTIL